MKPQMIVFGEDWGGLPSSTQHIIRQMTDSYSVTWINSLGLRSPRADWHDFKRVLRKGGRLVGQLLSKSAKPQKDTRTSQPENTLSVVEPRYLPFPGNPLARRINRRLLTNLLSKHAKPATTDQRPVIWVSLPNAVDALYYLEKTGLQDAVVIYYCCDDFAALSGVDHQAITLLEQELVGKAEVVVATSDALMNKFPAQKSHMVPHGVDIGLFYSPVPRAEDLPEGRPVAGFYGSIADWVDLTLLEALAKRMNEWNFVMIGQAKVDVSTLEALPNVYFLGAKPHHELPRYSQHWQASLLPFVQNGQIEACNPLKLREYLAAGKPVVATDFAMARQYAEHVSIADGVEGFAQALEATLREKPAVGELRRRRVAGESWQAVAGRIDKLIKAA